MFPVTNLDDIKINWILIKQQGYILYGFLLYTICDKVLCDYMKDGLFELDYLSGKDCAIFVLDSPSQKWIDYAKKENHDWLRVYGKEVPKNKRNELFRGFLSFFKRINIENNENCLINVGNNNFININDILSTKQGIVYPKEVFNVANHFGLKSQDIPCLIFFKNFDDNILWKTLLKGLNSQKDCTDFFRDFFDSNSFKELLKNEVIS